MNQSRLNCDDDKDNMKNKYNDICMSNCYQVIPGIGPTGPQGPADNTTALTITPLVGGTEPVLAHLTIIQIA